MKAHPSKNGEAKAPKAAKADGLKKPDGGRVPSMQELMGIVEEKHLTRQREAEDRGKRSPEQNMMDGSRDVYLEQLEGLSGRRSALASAKRPQFIVAVVLGKALCSGRISVEHAARCSALARALLERRLDPDQVVFTASAASKAEGCGDDATVACSYFLHLCEALGVPLDPESLVVSPTPVTTRVGMQSLLERFVVPQLSATAGLHLTFFASDYQLSRLERIGAVTPHLSLFAPLAERRDVFLQHVAATEALYKTNTTRKGQRPRMPSLSAKDGGATSWALEKVLYPPGLLISSGDAFAASFLAQTHVIFDSLVPLLLNFHAIVNNCVNKEEILAAEYYDDLLLAKRRVSEQLQLVDSPMRPAALRLKTMATASPHALARQAARARAGRRRRRRPGGDRRGRGPAWGRLVDEDEPDYGDLALSEIADFKRAATSGARRRGGPGALY
ncbi:hypothetical protein SO694_00109098 [Aureococcus anophagefferens]|uniref:DUF218 domain-containing protein n=1 Tax=Aureococcus anophagefferens TaxID=44056 RepID=A0ABR1FM39_AURAN